MAKNTGSPVRTGIFRVLPGPDRKPGINNFKDRRPDLNPPVRSGSVHSGPVQVQIQVWTDLCTPLRTTQKSATRETPFALAFGTEAVAPVEVGIKSLRVELASEEQNDEALRLNLELLDERREQVQQRTEEYQRKTARYYNKRVKPRSYVPGDLVLKKLLPARKNPAHGKLGPNWEGPYIISRVVRPGNYELQTEEGKVLQHTWNAEHLKRFYQ